MNNNPGIESLVCEGDKAYRSELIDEVAVNRCIEKAMSAQEKDQDQTRRFLLGSSLRLTEMISPGMYSVGREVMEKTGRDEEMELYVYPQPQFNAGVFKPEGGRLIIIVSSSLVESFSDRELMFILGHEVGHLVAGHHSFPAARILASGRGPLSSSQVLKLFAWQRFAEISADRIGAYCTRDFNIGGNVFFKLASGVGGSKFNVVLDDYLEQMDILAESVKQSSAPTGMDRSAWYSTHPFSPIRLKALQLFHGSRLYKDSIENIWPEDFDMDLEGEIREIMDVMSPGYLADKSDEAEMMRRVLFAAGILVAAASGKISDEETNALESLLGESSIPYEPDLKRLRKTLPGLIDTVNESVSRPRRVQIVRDLCLISVSDGKASVKELKLIRKVSGDLDIDPDLVEGFVEDFRRSFSKRKSS